MTSPNADTPTALELAAALEAGTATVEVDGSPVLSWDCDCMNSGAVWPDANLVIRLGAWSTRVAVWMVGCYDGGRWTDADDDGQYRGRPRVTVDEDYERLEDGTWAEEPTYGVAIHGGDNIGTTEYLDGGADEAAAEHAAEIIGDSLDAAYDELSIAEPDVDDIDPADGDRDATVHALMPVGSAAQAVELDIVRCGHPIIAVAGMDEECGAPVVWAVRGDERLADLRGDTERELRDRLGDRLAELEQASDRPWLTPGRHVPTLYTDEREAAQALYDWANEIVEDYDTPDGVDLARDDEGLYLRVESAEPYHLDIVELSACLSAGSLAPAIELARAAWSRRAGSVDDGDRRADAILAARDVYVTEADSIAAGNCPRGTALFAAQLRRQLAPDGEIGAASARYVLAARNDPFTLRACRHAALRIAGQARS